MAQSFQNEIPKARINIKLDLHTGGARKKVELPLKLLVMGDDSHGQEQHPLSEREKGDINKNNFDRGLAEFRPAMKTRRNRTDHDLMGLGIRLWAVAYLKRSGSTQEKT